jgi:hypothetical protein
MERNVTDASPVPPVSCYWLWLLQTTGGNETADASSRTSAVEFNPGIGPFTVVVRHIVSGLEVTRQVSANGTSITLPITLRPTDSACFGVADLDWGRIYIGQFWWSEVTIYNGVLTGNEVLVSVGKTSPTFPVQDTARFDPAQAQFVDGAGRPGPWPPPPFVVHRERITRASNGPGAAVSTVTLEEIVEVTPLEPTDP